MGTDYVKGHDSHVMTYDAKDEKAAEGMQS